MDYLIWGEEGNGVLNYHDPQATEFFLNEWAEVVARDFNHPAIVGWCPFNETWGYIEKRTNSTLLLTIYHYTRLSDTTRPCIDTSGGYHAVTDIFDVHNYDQNPENFKKDYDRLGTEGYLKDPIIHNEKDPEEVYNGEPVFISEYRRYPVEYQRQRRLGLWRRTQNARMNSSSVTVA